MTISYSGGSIHPNYLDMFDDTGRKAPTTCLVYSRSVDWCSCHLCLASLIKWHPGLSDKVTILHLAFLFESHLWLFGLGWVTPLPLWMSHIIGSLIKSHSSCLSDWVTPLSLWLIHTHSSICQSYPSLYDWVTLLQLCLSHNFDFLSSHSFESVI